MIFPPSVEPPAHGELLLYSVAFNPFSRWHRSSRVQLGFSTLTVHWHRVGSVQKDWYLGTVPQRFWFNSSDYPWASGFLKVYSPGHEGLDWGGGGLEEEEGRKRERSSFDFWSQQGTLLEQRLLSDDEKWVGSIDLRAHLKKEPWMQKQDCFNGLIMHTLVFPNDFI